MAELNKLESCFLDLLGFNLYIHPDLYEQYSTEIETQYRKIVNLELMEDIKIDTENCPKISIKSKESSESITSSTTLRSSNEISEVQ